MKKTILAFACMAGLALLTACGGNSGKKSDSGKITMKDVKEKAIETSVLGDATKEACQAAFKGIGLTLAQVTPDFKYLDVDSVKIYRGVVYQGRYEGWVTFVKEDMTETTREEFENYVRKLYAVTQEIADEHKVINGYERKSKTEEAEAEWAVDDILAQKVFGFPLSSFDWGFKRDGKFMRMSVELLDANKNYPARLSINFCEALQKSMDETMKDAEKALEDPEVQKALKDAFKK